jgi:hypothetical protein
MQTLQQLHSYSFSPAKKESDSNQEDRLFKTNDVKELYSI